MWLHLGRDPKGSCYKPTQGTQHQHQWQLKGALELVLRHSEGRGGTQTSLHATSWSEDIMHLA